MAECGQCRDCKWWNLRVRGNDDADWQHWGACRRFTPQFNSDKPVHPGALALVPFSGKGMVRGYGRPFETADTFGCVQWECKGG